MIAEMRTDEEANKRLLAYREPVARLLRGRSRAKIARTEGGDVERNRFAEELRGGFCVGRGVD